MIKIILRTRPGELLMHPEFGAGLESMVHQPNTLETRRAIHDLVASSVSRWEPRVLLDRVEVSDVPADPAEVRVEIAYRLRQTGAAQQLGLSLTLGA
jgi:phage baseplate assembly protein W